MCFARSWLRVHGSSAEASCRNHEARCPELNSAAWPDSRIVSVEPLGGSTMSGSGVTERRPRARSPGRLYPLAAVLVLGVVGSFAEQGVPSERRLREYNADVPKTILELQQFREIQSIHIKSNAGRTGVATLANLNPTIGAWYLLTVAWDNGPPERTYHLENPSPPGRKLLLDERYPLGVVVLEGTHRYPCDLFGADSTSPLEDSRSTHPIFRPLCESRIYLRNSAVGRHTGLEVATDFLRQRVWGGERMITLGHHLLGDTNLDTGTIRTEAQAAGRARQERPGPLPALIDPRFADRLVASDSLGITLEDADATRLAPGVWYAAKGNPGIYVSMLQPGFIAPDILRSHRTTVNSLDGVEPSALCYVIAFDLDRLEIGYAGGTEHPGVEWSERAPPRVKNPRLPGPDGIGSIAPLRATGLVSPDEARRTVATFTSGFKRTHSAFSSGDLSLKNHGSHYGVIESGVVFSKLQPGLATVVVMDDGSIEMKTWQEADNPRLPRIMHARQNGVPIIEFDEASQSPVPGRLVGRWGPGNWSGSENVKLRTIRAGLALQNSQGKRFLLYAVFSAATPSAMARVFQAYRCQYAMPLDMNALEHTYLALYRTTGSHLTLDHLIKGMSQLDKSRNGQLVPRFLGYPDNRDFFYVMRRENTADRP